MTDEPESENERAKPAPAPASGSSLWLLESRCSPPAALPRPRPTDRVVKTLPAAKPANLPDQTDRNENE